MSDWEKSKIEFFEQGDFSSKLDCIVIIKDKMITLSYDYEGHNYKWEGENNNSGHFSVEDKYKNKGTLHMFPDKLTRANLYPPDDVFLEGYWSLENNRGMWRITLG